MSIPAMPHYHPNTNILTEYAAGTLPPAQSVAVKAHLHYCSHCRQALREIESIGGAMLEELKPSALAEGSFNKLMEDISRLSQSPTLNSTVSKPLPNKVIPNSPKANLPNVVTSLIEKQHLKWRKVSRTLQSATLSVGQKQYEVSLQRIKAGESVPEHDHKGMEITVVLEGSFSDKEGIYHAGDFLVKEPGEIHQPISAKHQDCLCLAIQESPVKLTSFFGKLINPFIRLHAA